MLSSARGCEGKIPFLCIHYGMIMEGILSSSSFRSLREETLSKACLNIVVAKYPGGSIHVLVKMTDILEI